MKYFYKIIWTHFRRFGVEGVLLFSIFLFFGQKVRAQDPHFSQFYSTPLQLNPAITGLLEGDFRAIANYRTQWGSIATPFQTMSGSVDFNVLNRHLGKDMFGIGLMVMNDQAGSAELRNTQVQVSAAFHKAMNNLGNHFVSIGGQYGFSQQTLNYSKLLFESQFDGEGLNPSVASGENLAMNEFFYEDMSAGFAWSYSPKKQKSFYMGVSMSHLNQPKVSFFDNYGERLQPKLTIYAGANFGLNKYITIIPRGVYLSQGVAREINVGALLKFNVGNNRKIEDKTAIYFGTMHRLNDAQILLIRYDYGPIGFSFSYDMNISKLNIATGGRGAMELALIYRSDIFPDNERRSITCPKF